MDMVKMNIYYFNDETRQITVQVNGQLNTSDLSSHGELDVQYFLLLPSQGRMFTVNAPLGTIPFVKKWNQVVLLSYADPDLLLGEEGDEGQTS